MTIILRHGFTVGRFTQTLLKNIFSEILLIADYDGLFTDKKIKVSKYRVLILEVERFTNQVRFRLDLSGRMQINIAMSS